MHGRALASRVLRREIQTGLGRVRILAIPQDQHRDRAEDGSLDLPADDLVVVVLGHHRGMGQDLSIFVQLLSPARGHGGRTPRARVDEERAPGQAARQALRRVRRLGVARPHFPAPAFEQGGGLAPGGRRVGRPPEAVDEARERHPAVEQRRARRHAARQPVERPAALVGRSRQGPARGHRHARQRSRMGLCGKGKGLLGVAGVAGEDGQGGAVQARRPAVIARHEERPGRRVGHRRRGQLARDRRAPHPTQREQRRLARGRPPRLRVAPGERRLDLIRQRVHERRHPLPVASAIRRLERWRGRLAHGTARPAPLAAGPAAGSSAASRSSAK